MIDTFFGHKAKQNQAWNTAGIRVPITIVKVNPMTVTQIKTADLDGYEAIQIGFGAQKWQALSQPLKGHLKPSLKEETGTTSKMGPRFLREIRGIKEAELKTGATITIDQIFTVGDQVNVTGLSRGRGFAGVMKRWGFKGGPKTHGQSDRSRAPGSIGQGTDPGRVHKGKKMPGHFGATQSTVRNLTVLKIDPAKNELWLKGQVPGTENSVVKVTKIGHKQNTLPLIDPYTTPKKKTAAEPPKPTTEAKEPETKTEK